MRKCAHIIEYHEVKGGKQMKARARIWGIAVSALGVGVLLAFFLPESVLVVIEAVVIVTAGCLFMKS